MTKLWRTEIPGGAAGSPYRLGVLLDDGIAVAPDADVTAAWLTDHRKHFQLDKLVELAAVGNEVRAQSIGAADERAAPLESRIAAAAVLAWQRARRLLPGTRLRVVLDGSPIAPAGDLAGLDARPVRLMSPTALATVIAEKNRPTRDALMQSLRSSMGVIPFVGAGLSADFNFPQWGDLLRWLARPNQKAQVDTLVRRDDFERAAELSIIAIFAILVGAVVWLEKADPKRESIAERTIVDPTDGGARQVDMAGRK